MSTFLKKIDFFSRKPSLAFKGSSRYRTAIGGLTSIVSVILALTATLIFGKEFVFKTKPKVISSEFSPTKSEIMHINTANYTVLWGIVQPNGRRVMDPASMPVFPKISYYEISKNEEGMFKFDFVHVFKWKICSETKATENPLYADTPLDLFFCLDFDEIAEIKGEPAKIGGYWDENEINYIKFEFSNCKFDSETGKQTDCLSSKEYKRRLSQSFSINLNVPNSYFEADSLETPLKSKTKVLTYLLSDTLRRVDYIFSKISYLFDDQGWLFEDTTVHLRPVFDRVDSNLSIMSETYFAQSKVAAVNISLYMAREQKRMKRSFMKIQELGAFVGGVVKAINTFLNVLLVLPNSYCVDCDLLAISNRLEMSSHNITQNNSVSGLKSTKMTVKVPKITFYAYIKGLFSIRFSKLFHTNSRMIWSKLDLKFILEMSKQMDQLQEVFKSPIKPVADNYIKQ